MLPISQNMISFSLSTLHQQLHLPIQHKLPNRLVHDNQTRSLSVLLYRIDQILLIILIIFVLST